MQCLHLPGRAVQLLAQRQSVPSQIMRLFNNNKTATKTIDLVFPYQLARIDYSCWREVVWWTGNLKFQLFWSRTWPSSIKWSIRTTWLLQVGKEETMARNHIRLPPWCWWGLRSFGLLRSIRWQLFTEVSKQPIGSIFEGQTVQEECREQVEAWLYMGDGEGKAWFSWRVS